MEIRYNNKNVEGKYLTTKETQIRPIVSLSGLDNNKSYDLIMYDPKAVGGNHIHWIFRNIKGNNFESGNDFFTYNGPHPPENSGIHDYIFSLYESGKDVIPTLNPNHRQVELKDVLQNLEITGDPIYTKQFTSEYQKGGKHKRKYTKKRKSRGRRSYKRRRIH